MDKFKKRWADAVVDKESLIQDKFISTGSLAVDKVLGGGFPVGKMVELYGPPRCVTGCSLVLTPQGLRYVSELGNTVTLMNEYGEWEEAEVISNGIRPVTRIVTENGLPLSATKDHPVRSLTDSGHLVWVPLGELKKGAIVVTRGGCAYDTKPLSSATALFLGYFAARGRLGPRGEVILPITPSASAMITGVVQQVADELGVTVSITVVSDHLVVQSDQLRSYVQEQSATPIPLAIRSATASCLASFWAGASLESSVPEEMVPHLSITALAHRGSLLGPAPHLAEIPNQRELLRVLAATHEGRVPIPAENAPFTYSDLAALISWLDDHHPYSVNTTGKWVQAHFRDIWDNQYLFQRVTSVEYIGEEEVFDFSLPESRSFWVNGFCTHNSGKTTLALATAARAQKEGKRIAYFDWERALDLMEARGEESDEYEESRISWLRRNGVDPMDPDFVLLDPPSGEVMVEMLEDIIENEVFDLVIVDSVAGIVTEAEIKGDIRDAHYGAVARLLSAALKRITSKYRRPKGEPPPETIIIWINQVRDIIGQRFQGSRSTGGRALEHYVSTRLMLQRIGESQEGSEMVTRSRVKVAKARFAPPGHTEIGFSSQRGLDLPGEVIDIGIKKGYIHRAGAWYSVYDRPVEKGKAKGYEPLTRVQGKSALKDFLTESGWLETFVEKFRGEE